MARGFTSTRRGFQAPKRQIANDGLDSEGSVVLTFLATDSARAIGSLALVVTVPAATLVRTRGALAITTRASGTLNNPIAGAVGMMVVSQEAAVVGITAVPTPMDDIENDWFVYEPFAFVAKAAGTEPAGTLSSTVLRQFDSRGQRKLKDGDALVVVVEAF